MQLGEIVLLVVVAALAVTVLWLAVRPYLSARKAAPASPREVPSTSVAIGPRPQPMVCLTCHRDYAPDLKFCPHDARDLVLASDPTARSAALGVTCSMCKRSYDAGKKFCAFDGEELVPLPVALGAAGTVSGAFAGLRGKICPNCSQRYESEATFCGRDGEELVPVN